MKKTFNGFLLSVLIFTTGNAQEAQPPFWNDIQHFRKLDSVQFPPKKSILFVGSSSFTNWKDVQEYFPGIPIINRGFGGSSIPDVIRYADDVIFPYKPKQVVIYCGENDLAASDTVSADLVFRRFKTLFQLIRTRMPGVPVAFVSLKPSPSRQTLWPKMVEANRLIKNYLKARKSTAFINVYPAMFNKDGSIMGEIFVSDSLHMNEKGYAIWQKKIKPYLQK